VGDNHIPLTIKYNKAFNIVISQYLMADVNHG